MRIAVLMIAAGALMASAAHATTEPVAATGQKVLAVAVAADTNPAARRAEPSRMLIVCDAEEDAGAVARDVDFGFVTAKQILAGRTWTGTKCITASEARRLNTIKLSSAK